MPTNLFSASDFPDRDISPLQQGKQKKKSAGGGEGLSPGRWRLSQATVMTNVIMNSVSSYSRVWGSQSRLPCAAPQTFRQFTRALPVLPLLPRCSLGSPLVLPLALSMLPPAPLVLPLKRPCSLSRTKQAISNPTRSNFKIFGILVFMAQSRKRLSRAR